MSLCSTRYSRIDSANETCSSHARIMCHNLQLLVIMILCRMPYLRQTNLILTCHNFVSLKPTIADNETCSCATVFCVTKTYNCWLMRFFLVMRATRPQWFVSPPAIAGDEISSRHARPLWFVSPPAVAGDESCTLSCEATVLLQLLVTSHALCHAKLLSCCSCW